MPKVSICVPNLNTRPYLPERFETIFNQTFQDWELIVCDSYSDDGSWEYIQELAAREPRMRISQTPRKGVFAGFNDCIQLARGEHVYIATSDDTMSPDFLEEMVAAFARSTSPRIIGSQTAASRQCWTWVPTWESLLSVSGQCSLVQI